jgi:hypothetical protein
VALLEAVPAVTSEEPDAGTVQAWEPEPLDETTADIHADPGGDLLAGKRLPEREEDMPKHWLRAPCPKGPRVRTIRSACFVAYGKPPCEVGFEERGECVIAINKGQKVPASIDGGETE